MGQIPLRRLSSDVCNFPGECCDLSQNCPRLPQDISSLSETVSRRCLGERVKQVQNFLRQVSVQSQGLPCEVNVCYKMDDNKDELVVACSCALILFATVAKIYSTDHKTNKANYLSNKKPVKCNGCHNTCTHGKQTTHALLLTCTALVLSSL